MGKLATFLLLFRKQLYTSSNFPEAALFEAIFPVSDVHLNIPANISIPVCSLRATRGRGGKLGQKDDAVVTGAAHPPGPSPLEFRRLLSTAEALPCLGVEEMEEMALQPVPRSWGPSSGLQG